MTLSKLPQRPAYTLIELMVVVGLIILLATLTVAVANSSLVDSYKIVGGADRLSGWLLTAKQRALRDKTPVGVRLIRDAENRNFIRQAQLVEMPTLYAPNITLDVNNLPPGGAPFVLARYQTIPATYTYNGQTYTDQSLLQESADNGVFLYWPNNASSTYPQFTLGVDLQIGDLLRIEKLKSTHRITAISAPSPTPPSWYQTPPLPSVPAGNWYKLTLALAQVQLPITSPIQPAPGYPPSPHPQNLLPANWVPPLPVQGETRVYPTGYPAIGGANFDQWYDFGLFRSSRPILGEPLLQLPANMAVDLTPVIDNAPVGPSANDLLLSQNAPLSLEVMFNPNGTVVFGDAGVFHFWLRDTRNGPAGVLSVTGTTPNASVPAVNDVFVDRARLMNSGEHVLVSVFTKTGAIATYPIFPPDQTGRFDGRPINAGGDGGLSGPYKYALKATNTGL